MRRISTFKTLVYSSALALLALTSNSSFAQCATPAVCPPVNIDFENQTSTGGNTYGFSVGQDFVLEGANSPNANSSFYLQSTSVEEGATKTLLSPGFTVTPNGIITYTFTLAGNATVTSYTLIAVTSTGEVPLCTSSVTYPNNSGVTICGQATNSELGGQVIRLKFVFTITGANSHLITFDNFGTNMGDPIILPVNFKGIAARKEAAGVNVQWNVAQEIDVKEYVVEKSADGKGFTKVGSVVATGSDVYAFADAAPINGVSFYRVKSVDIDGKTKYSTIVRINTSKSVALRAYPSPANNQVAIEHEALSARGKITISTADGKAVVAVNAIEGTSQTVIDLSKLNSGIYLVRLEKGNGQVESLKFVKL